MGESHAIQGVKSASGSRGSGFWASDGQLRRKSPPLHLDRRFSCCWVNGGDCNVV